uniref:Uncharacterized protein n=1 Tax=Bacteriophage sp. TaxID=38018 RepID=A0A8D9PEC1_9VIRU|nr:MAG TPA: hypothetical protein [Bacteriophage sp.]
MAARAARLIRRRLAKMLRLKQLFGNNISITLKTKV